MQLPTGRAGLAQIQPLMKASDSDASLRNWQVLDEAIGSGGRCNGTVLLPAGAFYLQHASQPAIYFDETRAYVIIQGAGRDKTTLIPFGSNQLPSLAAVSRLVGHRKEGEWSNDLITLDNPADLGKYSEDDVIYFWQEVTGTSNVRSPRQRIRVLSTADPNLVTLDDSVDAGYDQYMHMKGFELFGAPAAGSTQVILNDSGLIGNFSPGDDVLIGDGPGINEFYGEWVRVVSTSGATITVRPALQQSYATDLACIVPGWRNPLAENRRQQMSDIVFRDLSIAAPADGEFALMFGVVRGGPRIRFENVAFIRSPYDSGTVSLKDLSITTCGSLTMRDSQCEGRLVLGPVQNGTMDNLVASGVLVNEFSRDCQFLRTTTTGLRGFTLGNGRGSRIHLTDCVVRNHGASTAANVDFADDSVIRNVVLGPTATSAAIAVTGQRVVLDSVVSGVDIEVQGDDLRIANLTAPELILASGSSGVLTTPLNPPSATLTDNSTAGSWLTPLKQNVKNRKVQSPATTAVTLELATISGQSADLQQWQGGGGVPLVAIRADGNLATSQVISASAVNVVVGVMEVYDPVLPTTRIGYVPLYKNYSP